MYNQTYWKDHVVDGEGHVIQQGTNMDAQNFNNMEDGIQDAHVAEQILLQHKLQKERELDAGLAEIENEIAAEYGTKTLTNTDSYPFNNSAATVALAKTRDTINYTVEAIITAYSGGLPGAIHVTDKAINGFKLSFDGSAKSVTVRYIVKGGFMS